ncbi:quinol:cytochrome C oxidoreductase [Mucilaginibacter sp. KACC 22063]|uniref:quinol:cytochrome C oxidoreductase n=1 Tax=Mucilaginibacter sp. KACC 22063 TaxID=3025666 RepID=UPI0023660381|nr:quinol:cytochrome C oxidoreductase [Mucilaginibacter sp. KACC 22063]WDF56287.1 quinol:cytochrome C oxidoreductase [Mucilaginibacter sp. KACC 22063]
MKTEYSFDERFEFAGRAKTWSLIAIVIGVIGILYGFFLDHGDLGVQRTFSNLLLMSYYFVCVCICGAFFIAYNYLAQAGWQAGISRIPQAFIKVLPVAAVIFVLVAAAGLFTTHKVVEEGHTVEAPYLYAHWATKGLTTVGSENYDPIIAGKSSLLNPSAYFLVVVVLLAAYTIVGRMLVKNSEAEDVVGGMRNYKRNFNASCVFIAIFGFTFPIFAFDGIMSLEAHWFSTMFGWYNLAALHVSGLAVIALTLIFLIEKGNFGWVNENHVHTLGKLIFGFSIFWTYVWFAQFFLTWYANIPEEAAYFYKRWEPEYKWWFWLNIVLNFVAPLFVLMSRDSKRYFKTMKVACIIIIIGHWLDYYLMIMPGTIPPHDTAFPFGVEEIAIFLGFAGLFSFLMLTALSKAKSLVPTKHPFLEESLHHHI